jgi:hypothetical protein
MRLQYTSQLRTNTQTERVTSGNSVAPLFVAGIVLESREGNWKIQGALLGRLGPNRTREVLGRGMFRRISDWDIREN